MGHWPRRAGAVVSGALTDIDRLMLFIACDKLFNGLYVARPQGCRGGAVGEIPYNWTAGFGYDRKEAITKFYEMHKADVDLQMVTARLKNSAA